MATSYLCYHDCGDVGTVGDGHWFTISQSGEAFSLKNLTIFIPDRRLEDNRSIHLKPAIQTITASMAVMSIL